MSPMKFVHLTGKRLAEIISDGELHADDLHAAGVDDDSVVRINEQGDIEVRRPSQWDLVGGLLGDYQHRIKNTAGMDWV